MESPEIHSEDVPKNTDGSVGVVNVWCCIVRAKCAKPVKDELKARNWLDQSRKVIIDPGADEKENVCCFPLLDTSDVEEIREKQGIFEACW